MMMFETSKHVPKTEKRWFFFKKIRRRVPFAYQEGVQSDLKAMLEDGVIEKSNSEWASPLVIVKKTLGGSENMCGLQKIKRSYKN